MAWKARAIAALQHIFRVTDCKKRVTEARLTASFFSTMSSGHAPTAKNAVMVLGGLDFWRARRCRLQTEMKSLRID